MACLNSSQRLHHLAANYLFTLAWCTPVNSTHPNSELQFGKNVQAENRESGKFWIKKNVFCYFHYQDKLATNLKALLLITGHRIRVNSTMHKPVSAKQVPGKSTNWHCWPLPCSCFLLWLQAFPFPQKGLYPTHHHCHLPAITLYFWIPQQMLEGVAYCILWCNCKTKSEGERKSIDIQKWNYNNYLGAKKEVATSQNQR